MNFKTAFRKFLYDQSFLPLSSRNKFWKSNRIKHHRKEPPKEKLKQYRKEIKDNFPTTGGIYVYLNKKNELVYVGIAKNLHTRIRAHYKEAYRKGPYVWDKFFSDNAGELTVLWKEIKQDRQRRAVEEMIEEVVRSKFDEKFPRGKRYLTK